MQSLASEPIPYRRPPAIALLRAGRIVAANPALIDLCGYTRGELTSPEFRIAHLFPGAPPLPVPAELHASLADEISVEPLRGARVPCTRIVWRVDEAASPTLAVILERRDGLVGTAPEPTPGLHAAREVIRASSAQLAALIMRLRRIQLEIESIEHAHSEVLASQMRRGGPVLEQLDQLEREVDELARRAGTRA